MHPLLQNRFVKFASIGLGIFILIVIFSSIILASLNDARSTGTGMGTYGAPLPSSAFIDSVDYGTGGGMMESSDRMNTSPTYYPPQPSPESYTSGLENFETTEYSVTARTKEFDELCSTLVSLKADRQIHFKSLNESTNNCTATFYVDEEKAPAVLSKLTAFRDVEFTRNTESVTRHRQQIQSQTSILQQQLTSVQNSLSAAETQFDEIAEFAKENRDASTLSQAISQKLNNINNLTQQKINLTSQLNNLYQQASDLEERMGVIQFYVNISRSNPIYANQESLKWERAWKELKDTYTDTLIGLSAFFGIFVLWAVRISIYLLVIIIILRGLMKFAQFIWKK